MVVTKGSGYDALDERGKLGAGAFFFFPFGLFRLHDEGPARSSEESSQAFADAATMLAHAQIPATILPAFGLGRVVALTKPSGGTRGLVAGDVFRRIVARTLAQQFAGAVEEACPHQYALGNRAGLDALVIIGACCAG